MYSPTLEYRNVIDIEYRPITVIVLEECNRDPDNAVIVYWNLGQAIDIDTGGVYEPFIFAWAFVRFRRQRASRHVECREPFDIAKFFLRPVTGYERLGRFQSEKYSPVNEMREYGLSHAAVKRADYNEINFPHIATE